MSSIEQLIFSNGERYPILMDDEGMPDFWITLFITAKIRPKATQNTITSYISDLRHFLLWEQIEGRDVIAEFQKLQFLSDIDCLSLRDHCLLKTDGARKWNRQKNKSSVRKICNEFPLSPRLLDRVSGNHARNRISRIAEYLAFTARAILRTRPNIAQINKKIDAMKTLLLVNRPASSKSRFSADPNTKAPPLDVFQAFIEAVQFGALDNPYKNRIVKKRNSMIFNILDATGIRASELLGLKLSDIDWHENVISIKRSHDDPVDPRTNQPVQKTLSRDIPVSAALIGQIMDYIENERAKTLNVYKHPFLCVTHQRGPHIGKPLSDSGFTKIVKQAANKVGQASDNFELECLINEITRHGFRHNFNYKLSNAFDAHNKKAEIDNSIKKIPEREQNQIRMNLNGWSSEETASTYNLRHIKEISNKLMREDMEEQGRKIWG